MGSLRSISELEEFGQVQLSKSFFMREFLYSEISQIEGFPNLPADPDMAIVAGKQLCEKVLEPIQDALGRISIRSGYCASSGINKAFWQPELPQAECPAPDDRPDQLCPPLTHPAQWDQPDADGYVSATACVIVTAFLPYYHYTNDWTALAWWIHDQIPHYADMTFFPNQSACNISWHENADRPKYIYSYVENPHTGKTGYLTHEGMSNFAGSHEADYAEFLQQLRSRRASDRQRRGYKV